MTAVNIKSIFEADRHACTVSEFIKNKLYFVTYRNKTHRNTTDFHFFTTDDELIYVNFYNDFGPLNIAAVYKFCQKVMFKLKSPALASKVIVQFTSMNEKKRVNAAWLMAAFAIIHLNYSPRDAYQEISSIQYPFVSFQDASITESVYKIRLIDCLTALKKAIFFGLINFDDFDVDEYERLEKLQNGDMNWIIPQKLLAFSGPVDKPPQPCFHEPEFYIDYFHKNDIKTVVRLNAKAYNAKAFTNAGIAHYDLFFEDGTDPTYEIMARFLEICESTTYAVAVHCKAGLGRTGCLIGAYLLKHYGMTALEAIAWMRMCRPGCIIGHQQTWLEEVEPSLWNLGNSFRKRYYNGQDRIPFHNYGIYSKNLKTNRSGVSTFEVEGINKKLLLNTPFIQKKKLVQLGESEKPPASGKQTQGDRLNLIKKWKAEHILHEGKRTPK